MRSQPKRNERNTLMNRVRYVGMDVHRDTISVAVVDEQGRLMMESVLAPRAEAILDFIHGVRGTLHVTLEEGTHSAGLYDLLVRRVAKLVVCNPRKNARLKSGSKSDAIDARKLAERLRADMLSAVYHGETSALEVQHVARSYTRRTSGLPTRNAADLSEHRRISHQCQRHIQCLNVERQRRHVIHRVRECGSAQFHAGQRLNILNALNLGSDELPRAAVTSPYLRAGGAGFASILTPKGAPR